MRSPSAHRPSQSFPPKRPGKSTWLWLSAEAESQTKLSKKSINEQSHDYFDLESLRPENVAIYNVARLRTDIWHFLRDSARRLHRITKDKKSTNVADVMWLTDACTEVFDFLRPLEDFFVFPSRPALEQVAATFERQRYEDLARQTMNLNRMRRKFGR